MWKDEVWKVIFFFHTNNPRKYFYQTFQAGKWPNFFHTFQEPVGILDIGPYEVTDHVNAFSEQAHVVRPGPGDCGHHVGGPGVRYHWLTITPVKQGYPAHQNQNDSRK